MSTTTLVSAFVPGCNAVSTAIQRQYITWGQQLVDLPLPKVVYAPPSFLAQLRGNEHTVLVDAAEAFAGFPDFLDALVLPSERGTTKDTARFMWLIQHKTEFCRAAMLRNPFRSTHFVWLDFGLAKVVRDPHAFATGAAHVVARATAFPGRVRLSRVEPEPEAEPETKAQGSSLSELAALLKDDENAIQWYFTGGVFGGDEQALMRFADAAQHALYQLVFEHRITWEVKTWHKIHVQHRDWFEPYLCRFDASMLHNF